MSEENISKSKAKRLAQEQARKKQKAAKTTRITITAIVLTAIAALIIGIAIYVKSTELDYSKGLNNEGLIDINIDDYCTTTYENMSFSKADLLPTDETVEADILSLRENYKELSEDASLVIASGDTVNISYVSTLNGEEIQNITAEDGGYDYEVGSNSFSESFDEALVGKSVGESFTVDTLDAEVTVSDDSTESAISYEVTINGIYVLPEFDDAFIAENFAGTYSTAEEYRQGVIDYYYDANLENAIEESLSENCVVLDIPEKYYKNSIKVTEKADEEQFEYYSELYAQYGMTLNNVYELHGLSTEEEYNSYLEETALESVKNMLYYQAVYEKAGLTNTEEEVKAFATEQGWDDATYEEYVETYGYPFVANYAATEKIMEYLKGAVTITE